MSFRPCAIIPSHNHSAVVGSIVDHLKALGLAVFVIDDGSDDQTGTALAALNDPGHSVWVHRLTPNRGKGGAVIEGFKLATAAHFTHAVQVDADGQHDLAALPKMLALGATYPQACIVGTPVFDRSMPMGRRIGRWITHFWVSIETLTPRVIDSMCGFRLYPLTATVALLRDDHVRRGMDFDTDILVRLIWRGVAPIFTPVAVRYPAGNTSNFRVLRDNWRITVMHTVLVMTMLVRLQQVIRHRPKWNGRPDAGPSHWAAMAERGSYWGLLLLAAIYRLTGRQGLMIPLALVAFFFHITGREQRRASEAFLRRAFAARGETRAVTRLDVLRHSLGFADKAAETVIGWLGGLKRDAIKIVDPAELEKVIGSGKGILLVVSHLGNADLSRALLDDAVRDRLTVLIHSSHAANYMKLLGRFRPEAATNTLQVTDMSPGTIITLKDSIAEGNWIVIAGDRTPVNGADRVSYVPFLGADAPFPHGPYFLAHLLDCPVYLMFCLREGDRYHLYFEKFADQIALPRGSRQATLDDAVARYASRLEAFCLKDPFQWYNFFDFWPPRPAKNPAGSPAAARDAVTGGMGTP